jgi:hypothetical protein
MGMTIFTKWSREMPFLQECLNFLGMEKRKESEMKYFFDQLLQRGGEGPLLRSIILANFHINFLQRMHHSEKSYSDLFTLFCMVA